MTVGMKIMHSSFFFMWSWMEFLALSTGYWHCPAPLGSSVLQPVTCFQHSSSAKSQKLWTCILRQRLRTKFFNAEGFSLTQFHRHLRSMYGEDIIDVSSVIHWIHCSNSSEKTLVIGPTVFQQRVLQDRHTASYAKMESVLIMKEILYKNHLNFVKDVWMIYVHFIITVSIIPARTHARTHARMHAHKQKSRHFFCTTPHT